MIDIENQVFNYVVNALRAEFPNINVSNEEVETPESFPAVSIVESNNAVVAETSTLRRLPETACTLMYTVNIYSNLQVGQRRSQAKRIAEIVDDRMREMGFRRNILNPMENLDRTIYRMVGRYTKTYQIY